MTEPTVPGGGSPSQPVPDLGFFAGPTSGGGSAFGPPTSNPFGIAGQLAPPSTGNPSFGAPGPNGFSRPVAPPAPAGAGFGTAQKLVAAVAVLVVFAAMFVGGRFGWRHFMADPVLPETLQGVPLLTGPEIEAGLSGAREQVGDLLATGSEARIGLYTSGQSQGYMLFAVRGATRSSEESEELAGATTTQHGKVQCFQQGAETGVPVAATMCVRDFFRRAVIVIAFGAVAPSPETVAAATEEAWDAQ